MATKQEKIENYFKKMDYNNKNNIANTNYDEVIQWIQKNECLKVLLDENTAKTILIESAVTKKNFQFSFASFSKEEALQLRNIPETGNILKDFQQKLKQNYGLICKMQEFFNGIPVKYSENILIPAIEKLFTTDEEMCLENTVVLPNSSFCYTNLWKTIKKIVYDISNSRIFLYLDVGAKNDLPVVNLLRQILFDAGFCLILRWKSCKANLGDYVDQIPMIIFKDSDLHSATSIAIESAFTKPPIVGQIDTIFVEESALDSFIGKLKSKLNAIQEMLVPFKQETLEKVEKEAKSLGLEIYQVNLNKSKATLIIGGKPFSNMEILEGKLYNAGVLYLIPFRTKEDVLALLKKTPSTYGASIWSEYVTLVNEMTEKAPVKHVWINCCGLVEYKTKNEFKRKEIEGDVLKIQEGWNNTPQAEKLKLIKEFLNVNNSIECMPELRKKLKIFLQDLTSRSSYKNGNYLITIISNPIGQIQFEIANMECKEIFLVLTALLKGNVVNLKVCSTKVEKYKSLFKVFVDKGIVQIITDKVHIQYSISGEIFKKSEYELIKEFETLSKQVWMPI